jgi:hypothetical protein
MNQFSIQIYNQNFHITMPVYIASMNMRGSWAPRPSDSVVLNVTSAQAKSSPNRVAFSPMTPRPYKGFACFENYWQSGKVYESIDREKQLQWWHRQTEGKRRYPNSKGMKVLHSDHGDRVTRDYISSRKEVYVPEYHNLVCESDVLAIWKRRAATTAIVVYDFDGPRLPDGTPTCLPITKELLVEKINDTTYPFGHGYVVAALLSDIHIESYIH